MSKSVFWRDKQRKLGVLSKLKEQNGVEMSQRRNEEGRWSEAGGRRGTQCVRGLLSRRRYTGEWIYGGQDTL